MPDPNPNASLRAQLQVDDPTTPGNLLGSLASKWWQWRTSQPELDPADPATYPVTPGGLGGVVRGTSPAAEGLADFVRRVWPSLGKTADALPDMPLHYGGSLKNRAGQFSWMPDASTRIDIPATIEGLDKHQPAQQAVQSYLHELLHAIYYGKTGGSPFPPRGGDIWSGVKGALSAEGQAHYANDVPHGAIHAMAQNIYRKRVANPSMGVLPEFQ